MTETIQQMMARRKSEIKVQLSALRQEMTEIKTMEAAMPSNNRAALVSSSTKSSDKVTIKEMILNVLSDRSNGATANEIVEMIKSQYDKDIQRSSLSPQLSRLRLNDKKIDLNNEIWSLSISSTKKEAPAGASDDVVASSEYRYSNQPFVRER